MAGPRSVSPGTATASSRPSARWSIRTLSSCGRRSSDRLSAASRSCWNFWRRTPRSRLSPRGATTPRACACAPTPTSSCATPGRRPRTFGTATTSSARHWLSSSACGSSSSTVTARSSWFTRRSAPGPATTACRCSRWARGAGRTTPTRMASLTRRRASASSTTAPRTTTRGPRERAAARTASSSAASAGGLAAALATHVNMNSTNAARAAQRSRVASPWRRCCSWLAAHSVGPTRRARHSNAAILPSY
ncbi:hypothetical protein M885DRAFT_624331 [Pelagophyceae sp. CCMP2097]|nr:hypothetical protein M885DRAFT_624331 [Pelagophyceae sp. CCMP2097]